MFGMRAPEIRSQDRFPFVSTHPRRRGRRVAAGVATEGLGHRARPVFALDRGYRPFGYNVPPIVSLRERARRR